MQHFLQVADEAGKSGESGFANFKRIVWHKSFHWVVQSIMLKSQMGCWHQCGDGITRHLFPFILILSADYEEQYVLFFRFL